MRYGHFYMEILDYTGSNMLLLEVCRNAGKSKFLLLYFDSVAVAELTVLLLP